MKIKNLTTKIIGVAGTAVLPNEVATISDCGAKSSMVKHFVKTGKISFVNDAVSAGGSVKEPLADEAGEKKKPLSRMNKDELVEECLKLGLDILEDDTKDTLVEKLRGATAE